MHGPDPAGTEPVLTPPKIHLTAEALDRVRAMLEEEELLAEGGLRISAHHGGGCSAPLQFDLILEHEPEADDVVLSAGGIRIFLDPGSTWSLDGLQIDYVESPILGSGFAFQHPRGTHKRSC